MKKKRRKLPSPIIPILSIMSIVLAAVAAVLVPFFRNTEMTDSGINYLEGTAMLLNPGRGQSQEISDLKNINYDFHQQIKIYEFSMSLGLFTSAGIERNEGNAGGKDAVISQEWLANLRAMFDAVRAKGAQAFCVFSYGTLAEKDLGKGLPVEPKTCVVPGCTHAHGADDPGGMHTVLYHIEQLSSVLNDYPDVQLWLYSSMLGLYGEQHGTPFATSQNLAKVVDKWFECTREKLPKITINVRGVNTFAAFYNLRHGTNYTKQSFHMLPETQVGTDEYRLGLWDDVFNNGFYDMGTFWDRANDIEWLGKQTAHTFYGGETANGGGGDTQNEWNSMPYFEHEAFKMNTSWLRRFGDDIQEGGLWRYKNYDGSDPVYNGQTIKQPTQTDKTHYNGKTTVQQYIERHLGYRFVVRKSLIQKNVQPNGKLRLTGTIENVGFGNILIDYRAQILLTDKNGKIIYSQPITINLNQPEYDVRVNLPELADGEYGIYLKLNKYSGAGHEEYDEKNPIMFANIDIYDAELKANKLGAFSVGGETNSNGDTSAAFVSTSAAPVITAVTIPREHSYVILKPGDTYDFTAVVTGTNNPPQTVTWALAAAPPQGNVNNKDDNPPNTGNRGNSTITAEGRLTVGSSVVGSTACNSVTFRVTATAGGKTATAYVKVHAHIYSLADNNTDAVLDKTNPYTFNGTAPLTVRVTNTGTTQTTGVSFLHIAGPNPDSFTLTGTSSYKGTPLLMARYGQLGVNQIKTFTVQPKAGLARGTYHAVVSVYGTWEDWDRTIIPTSGFIVSWTVG